MSRSTSFDVSRMTGRTLQDLLIDFAEHPERRDNRTYSFHDSDPNTVCCEIKANVKGLQT